MEKIKLVIVDDELTSRNALKKYLENSEIYEVIADFQNGKTALEWLRTNSVDILLSDMQMPEMNGVELMRNIHIIDEYLPVIAISGFDDFNFVRGSLVNGAANYLLKHELSKEYLLHALDQVREQYRLVPKGKTIYRKKGFIIHDSSSFRAEEIRHMVEEEKIDFSCSNICSIAVSPDYKVHDEMNFLEYCQDISKAVIDIASQILGENYPYIVYISSEYHLNFMISFANEKSLLFIMNTMNNLARRLQRQAIRMLDITLSIVCGDVHANLEEAMDEEPTIEKLLNDKFYLGENRIVYTSVVKPLAYTQIPIPEKYWEQLEFELSNHVDGYIDTIYEILNYVEKQQVDKQLAIQSVKRILQIMSLYGYIDKDQETRFLEQMSYMEVYGKIRTMIVDILHRKAQDQQKKDKTQYSVNITRVMEYIKKNYAQDVSLEDCAELVGCSYTTLSKEFRKETGMRFVEYLNQQRVNKAKSLLIRNDVSMKEIVESAGFRNYNYFFKVFKEIVGVTPSEFASKK